MLAFHVSLRQDNVQLEYACLCLHTWQMSVERL
jgi:hypothetical protein